jgi:hypothetical protein
MRRKGHVLFKRVQDLVAARLAHRPLNYFQDCPPHLGKLGKCISCRSRVRDIRDSLEKSGLNFRLTLDLTLICVYGYNIPRPPHRAQITPLIIQRMSAKIQFNACPASIHICDTIPLRTNRWIFSANSMSGRHSALIFEGSVNVVVWV